MNMPSGTQAESGPFARAVSAQIRGDMAEMRISATRLASSAGMSRAYLGRRLRDEVPFTLNDIEAICDAMGDSLLSFMRATARAMGDEL